MPPHGFGYLLAMLLATTGCGPKEKPQLAVFPATGQVLVDGRPAERAQVTFHAVTPLADPAGTRLAPTAAVGSDGAFAVTTYKFKDGLPVGDYLITVIWPSYTVDQGEEIAGPDRLQGRYSNPQRPAAKVTITAGPNIIPPIALKGR